MKAVAIVSGGMDSAALAYMMKDKGYDLLLLSFDYGQRHKKELFYAKIVADRLNAEHHIIDISGIQPLLKGSALTDDVDVPNGHYAEPSMKITIVPNRNAIMLSIAFGIASANQADLVGMAVHAGDHFIYPDCRPEFTKSFQKMSDLSLDGCHAPKLFTPFISLRKQDIAMIGSRLGVVYQDTWSCYKGGEKHCGRCGTCVERKEAFQLAGIRDLTVYEE